MFKNTGLTISQIFYLNKTINDIAVHLKSNSHDYQSKRSLCKFMNRKKKLILYYNRYKKQYYIKSNI